MRMTIPLDTFQTGLIPFSFIGISMRTAYIFLIAFLAWMVLFWFHYTKDIRNATPQLPPLHAPDTTIASASPAAERGIFFRSGSYLPLGIGGQIAEITDSVINAGTANQALQITGLYTPEEQAGLSFDLGLARANVLKKMLEKDISEDRIELFSDTLDHYSFSRDSLIAAIRFDWVDGYVPPQAANFYLLEHDFKRVKSDNFASLLDQIAQRLTGSGEHIIIRGHTDTSGGKELNFKIALRNAKDIRDYLLNKGLKRQQIKTTAQGEEKPVVDNDSPEGRRKNRRIELEIIPNQSL